MVVTVVGDGFFPYPVSIVLLFGLAESSYAITLRFCCLPLRGRALTLMDVRLSPSSGVALLEDGVSLVWHCSLRVNLQSRSTSSKLVSLVLGLLPAYHTGRLVTALLTVLVSCLYECVLASPLPHLDHRPSNPSDRRFASCRASAYCSVG